MYLFLKNKNFFLSWLSLFSIYSFLYSSEDKPFTRKPFNYKAFDARKKGHPMVIYRSPQEVVPSEYLKIIPSWPGYLRFPNPDNAGVFHVQAGGNWANWAYNSDRHLSDPSQVLFGVENPTLADLSLIARLHGYSLRDMPNPLPQAGSPPTDITTSQWITRTAEEPLSSDPELAFFGTLPPNTTPGSALAASFRANRRYLTFLADKVFDFKSKMREPFLTLSYQALMFQGKVAVGIELPIIYRTQKIDMVKELSVVDNEILSRASKYSGVNSSLQPVDIQLQDSFFAKYPSGYKDCWTDILRQKDFSTDTKSTRFGIGDITFL